MKPVIKTTLAIIAAAVLAYGCIRNELYMDKISKQVQISHKFALPLVYGDLKLTDFVGETTDSIITIEGDTVFQDTISLSLPDIASDFEIEYLNMPYQSMNYIPVGANLMLILYDSITATTLDTIKFAQTGIFLDPAPLDNSGNVIEDQVTLKEDAIVINSRTAHNLLSVATHIIVDARLLSDTTRVIPIDDKNRIWLKLGIDTKGSFTTSIDSLIN